MLSLTLVADLNGVTELVPKDDEETPFYYTFKVQCTACHEIHPNWVGVSRFETHEPSGSRGTAHFVWRCKNCKREHSASIKDAAKPYLQASPPSRQALIELDCRGLEFLEFRAEGDFTAVSSHEGSKTKFAVDLSEGEWYDYDEKAGEEVSITNCVWEMRRSV